MKDQGKSGWRLFGIEERERGGGGAEREREQNDMVLEGVALYGGVVS
jgi:hypothetical protein